MLFHPFEIAFCGYSGSGKTTLIAGIVRILSAKLSIAYYKHGCHRFDLDREGKDSWTIGRAGASAVMISDPEKKAFITRQNSPFFLLERNAFSDLDILLVEGLKEMPMPKLLMVDRDRRILDHVGNGSVTNVAALIVPDDPASYSASGIPVLQRDAVDDIAAFVETFLLERSSTETPLNGLVLAGGSSARMGSDKALISYHDQNQLLHTAALLQQECREVFVSCREEQAEIYRHFGVPLITDSYLGIGPLGGLLSAQRQCSGAAWITAACDMPFLNGEIIRQLTLRRNPLRYATAFRNPESGTLEPLSACYEPKSRSRLLQRHQAGNNSLAAFLEESRIEELNLHDPNALKNINDTEGRRNVTFFK